MNRKRYTFKSFLFDFIMTILTGCFWLIWVVIREVKRANGTY